MAPTDSSKKATLVTREYTINLGKLLHRETFKKKAPKAIKAIKKFANDVMKTKDVRLDVKLNKAVWGKGVRNIPRRIRVRIERKRSDDEDAQEELYSYVTVVDTNDFSGLGTKVVEDAE